MAEVISVRFNDKGKSYYFDPKDNKYSNGDMVVVDTARGIELGEVSAANFTVSDDEVVHPLREVVRPASEADLKRREENKQKEKRAFKVCEEKIAAHELDMKLVEVEYAFDGSKILFYFTADGRVDFRELVKDLASVFHMRIELRQIGVRDEAKMLGGLGICGRPFCCSRFLNDFLPVSIKMAKEQGLSLNPVKISGTCGRLMCCLNYEQNVYEQLNKTTPRVGSAVKTPDGCGTVIGTSILQQKVKVRLDGNDTNDTIETYSCADVRPLRQKHDEKPSDNRADAHADEKGKGNADNRTEK